MQTSEQHLTKYTPAYEPISLREPTEAEKRIDATLKAYMDVEMQLESNEEMTRRDSILAEVREIFIQWVQHVAIEVLHMPVDEAESAGGELFISGSHRLGVRDIGADIDTVCVAPNFCTREHFFTYLKEDLQKRSEVTELIAVEEAFVPIISFDYRNVSIDLLFARMSENSIPKDIDILDDKILIGLDEATEKSLNGPRVTNMIFKLVGEKTFPNFLIVLRCIRKWAKVRGIYGNKLGYLGGINCNIMVAFICQLYPNSSPSTLLFRFFKHYSTWSWPMPIMLNNIQSNPPGTLLSDERQVWSAKTNFKDLMPLITPAYPAMNSAFNVNLHSFEIMKNEIKRGSELIIDIIRDKKWEKLFEKTDFFLKYGHYLSCHILGTGDNTESRSWIGFVESRIRRLTLYPYLDTLPIKTPIQLFPIVSKTNKSEYSLCYFIGFDLDLDILRERQDKNIHIDTIASYFQESLLDPERGYRGERTEGLDFYIEHCAWKRLPREVFEPYGGIEAAKALRLERGYGVQKPPPSSTTSTTAAEKEKGAGEGETSATAAESKTTADTTATTPAADVIKTESLHNNTIKSEAKMKEEGKGLIQYDLGGKHYSSTLYEGFGANTVDTMDMARKKLRMEALGGVGEGAERGLFDKKLPRTLQQQEQVPVLLPPGRNIQYQASRRDTGNPPHHVSNVTWNWL